MKEALTLALEAGIEVTYDPTETPLRAFVECWIEDLERFSALVRADERERLLAGVEMPEQCNTALFDNFQGQAEYRNLSHDYCDHSAKYSVVQMRNFAAAAVAREREACAKVCEGINSTEDYYGERPELFFAEAIRARGNK